MVRTSLYLKLIFAIFMNTPKENNQMHIYLKETNEKKKNKLSNERAQIPYNLLI